MRVIAALLAVALPASADEFRIYSGSKPVGRETFSVEKGGIRSQAVYTVGAHSFTFTVSLLLDRDGTLISGRLNSVQGASPPQVTEFPRAGEKFHVFPDNAAPWTPLCRMVAKKRSVSTGKPPPMTLTTSTSGDTPRGRLPLVVAERGSLRATLACDGADLVLLRIDLGGTGTPTIFVREGWDAALPVLDSTRR